jgi:NTE family protein
VPQVAHALGAGAVQTALASQRRRGLLIAAAASAAGCSVNPDHDHDGTDAPEAAPLARVPRVAWVFSSGGPRGFVHVGVLEALAELHLAPDLIVGASVGALIGVLRAADTPAADLRRLAMELQPLQMARLNLAGNERFSGSALAGWVREQVRVPLERLSLPVACVAQRVADGRVVGFSRGDAGVAVQASAAIPGTFSPVRIRGQRYIDADGVMPLPVRLARALGATRVLAVDASAHEERAPPGAEPYRQGDLKKRALTRPDAALADVLLHPEFGYWVSLSREFRERAAGAGYRATMADADRLRALHAPTPRPSP